MTVQEPRVGFGIDLSGYSTGKTAVAKALRSGGVVSVEVLNDPVFSDKLDGTAGIAQQALREVGRLTAFMAEGHLCVDVPIDLQSLGANTPKHLWELTLRPIDKAFSGLPPLADRIGSPVARFRHTLDVMGKTGRSRLGKDLFETYPAASLKLLGLPTTKGSYKNQQVDWDGHAWRATPTNGPAAVLAELASVFALVPDEPMSLNDDEFDAIVCALTAIAEHPERLATEALRVEMHNRLKVDGTHAEPSGYVLLARRPAGPVRVSRRSVDQKESA